MYKKTTLQNNLRVITHPLKSSQSVSLGIWAGIGGRYENDRVKGAAHFLEHILFKGSKKYSCDDIKRMIEGVGGTLNAFTAEECSCYFAKIPSKYLNRTFDVLSDMVFSPLIKKQDVDKERMVILEEIKMYRDLPQHFVLELLDGLMWPDHPLGKSLAGTFESVGNMNEKDLREFHGQHYVPNRIVIAASGHLAHDAFVDLIKKKAANLQKKPGSDFIQANNSQKKPKTKFFHKEIEQMHLALGAFAFERNHKDLPALSLLNVILGANMSSRLFSEVREKRGLAYAIGSSVKSLNDTGFFLVRAGVDNRKIVEATQVILKELKKIEKNGVTKNEFDRAKDYYLGQVLLGLEDTLDHMFWIGEAMLMLDKIRTYKDLAAKVRRVTLGDIKRVAGHIFADRNFNLSIVGPLKKSQEQELKGIMGL